MARPAAAPKTRRRPAAHEEVEDGGRPLGGEWQKVEELTLEGIAGWKILQAKGAYWEEDAEIAGNLIEMRFAGGQREVVVRVTGTNNEAVLRAMSSRSKEGDGIAPVSQSTPSQSVARQPHAHHGDQGSGVGLNSLLGHREETPGGDDELSRSRRR